MPPGENAAALYRLTCPGYFTSLGIPLLEGRDFDARDATSAPGAVIINAETAKRYWPKRGSDRQADQAGPAELANPWMTVVGVVGNVRHFGLDDVARREMFRPYSQAAWPVDDDRHQDRGASGGVRRVDPRRAAAYRSRPAGGTRLDDGRVVRGFDGIAALPDAAARGVRRSSRWRWRWSASTAW